MEEFVKRLLFPIVWFLFTEKTSSELKVNQNASLQTMWERSVYLLARCVCGGSKKSIYKKKKWRVLECHWILSSNLYLFGQHQALWVLCTFIVWFHMPKCKVYKARGRHLAQTCSIAPVIRLDSQTNCSGVSLELDRDHLFQRVLV